MTPHAPLPPLPPRTSRGFTLIELLVTIAIIAVLVGMLLGALGLIKRQQQRAMTKSTMNQISLALISYLDTYPLLGTANDSADFVASPWTFLGRNAYAVGNAPYLDISVKHLAIGPAAGPWSGVTDRRTQGDQLLDGFITTDLSNRFIWSISNRSTAAPVRWYTDKIYVRSMVGTPDKTKDDLVMRLTTENGQWVHLGYTEAMADVPPPSW